MTVVSVFEINAAILPTEHMATRHVAGIAALIKTVKLAATPDEIEPILTSSTGSFFASCVRCDSSIVDTNAAASQALGGSRRGDADFMVRHGAEPIILNDYRINLWAKHEPSSFSNPSAGT